MKKLFYIFACCFFVSIVSCEDKSKFLENKPNSNNNNSDTETSAPIKINGHEAIDLGLPSGTLWASCNIGASSPEQVGNYYAWGETKTKTSYTESNYKYQGDGGYKVTKYCTLSSYGIVDSKRELEAADDAAVANWGGGWRMPTKNEFQELFTKCTIKREKINNIYVDIFVGPNGQTIIFPDTGEKDGSTIKNTSLRMYWSSTLDSSYPLTSYGYWGSDVVLGHTFRQNGLPIRPVYKK